MADSLLDNYRQQSLDTWEAMAQVWAREREFIWQASQKVGMGLVDGVRLQPGQTLLDIAAGTGETSFAAARMVGDSGRVVATSRPRWSRWHGSRAASSVSRTSSTA